MQPAALPPDERERLQALHLLDILDTGHEESFDIYPKLARAMFGVPKAAVSLVDAGRQWFKAHEGLDFCETPRAQSFCAHAILRPGETMVIHDATQDPRFADNPLVSMAGGIRFYAGAPIFASGQPVGALCITDSKPRRFSKARRERLRLLARALTDTLQLRGVLNDLHSLALSDPLTNARNRSGLDRALRGAFAIADAKAGLLLLDLDGFKSINDLFGHAGGDAALLAMAERLKAAVQPGDTVARLGGDVFAVLRPQARSLYELQMLAGRLHRTLSRKFRIAGSEVSLRTSIGAAWAPRHGTDPAALSAAADRALYTAKRGGRGMTCLADEEPGAASAAVGRCGIEETLRTAFQAGGVNPFRLRYQPFHDAQTGALRGFEALIRWDQGKQEALPSEFIQIAESTGLITLLDSWVLRSACLEAASWTRRLVVAVNVSATSFYAGLEAQVTRALAESGLQPSRLKLEITETVMLQDRGQARITCTRLRERGIQIALDDFGCGHASLSYVRDLPLDEIKIDRSFVTGLDHGTRDAEFVRAIVGLGRALDVTTLAEGVETDLQRRVLLSQGVNAMQGFLFAKPLTGPETRSYMSSPREHAIANTPNRSQSARTN